MVNVLGQVAVMKTDQMENSKLIWIGYDPNI